MLYTKVKLSLSLTKHHAMKTYWGSEGTATCIPDLGTRWRWVVNFTPRERARGTHYIGANLEAVVKRRMIAKGFTLVYISWFASVIWTFHSWSFSRDVQKQTQEPPCGLHVKIHAVAIFLCVKRYTNIRQWRP